MAYPAAAGGGRQTPIDIARGSRRRTAAVVFILALAALLLSACATFTDVEVSQASSADTLAVIQDETTAGQTFVMRRTGLKSLTVWVAKEAGTQPILSVNLYHSPQDQTPIYSRRFTITNTGPVTLVFSPFRDPPGQLYYVQLKASQGSLRVLGRSSDAYPSGQAFVNGQPAEGDLAFRTTYDYNAPAMLGDLIHLLPDVWLALPLFLTLALPGWLVLDLSGLRQKLDGGEQMAVSIGLSVGLIPLVLLWTTVLGLYWSQWAVIAGGVVLLAVFLARTFDFNVSRWLSRFYDQPLGFDTAGKERQPTQPVADHKTISKPAVNLKVNIAGEVSNYFSSLLSGRYTYGILLTLIFLATLGTRLAMVRDFAAPAWVDSVHHALIARIISISGSFPSSYAPYSDVVPTEYHAGYHSGLVVFQWLSGLQLPDAMLLYGQVQNALVVFEVYTLAVALTNSRKTGLAAALVAGLASPMPAYYTSWGRYTQLAGLLVLPAVFLMVQRSFRRAAHAYFAIERKWLALGILALAGLMLVHYRVVAYLAVLLVAYFISQMPFELKPLSLRSISLRPITGYIRAVVILCFTLGVGALLLTLPWTGRNLVQLLPSALSPALASNKEPFEDFTWRFLTTAAGNYALAMAFIGLGWGVLHKPRLSMSLAAWVGMLAVLANAGPLHLPGGWLMNNTAVEIVLFIPISILAGYLAIRMVELVNRIVPFALRKPYWIAVIALGAVLGGLAAGKVLPILNADTELVRLGDRPALDWIDQNIPQNQTILINPFSWSPSLYAGNDGGYWIAPLTGRNTLPPPALYGFGSQESIQKINEAAKSVIVNGASPDKLAEILRAQGIQYIYTGVRGGPISTAALQGSPLFEQVYGAEGAYIFKLKR